MAINIYKFKFRSKYVEEKRSNAVERDKVQLKTKITSLSARRPKIIAFIQVPFRLSKGNRILTVFLTLAESQRSVVKESERNKLDFNSHISPRTHLESNTFP